MLGEWLGSGAAALRRRRERAGSQLPGLETRLDGLRARRGDGAGQDALFGRVTDLAAITGEARGVAEPGVRELTERAGTELRHALRELCDLTLAEGVPEVGFEAAVRRLAEAMPVPVQVTVDVGELPVTTAGIAYAVVCEALANVAGHARARRVVVTIRKHGTTVQVSVADDGDGGAQPVIGGGIVLLAARVAALGGLLHVDSPAGSGTHVTAELPYTGRHG
jgi:signal transduction histidine kinase